MPRYSDRRRKRAAALLPIKPPPMKPSDFIARHPVFTLDEFRSLHTASGRSPNTSAALLAYHVAAGHIRSARRGLYVSMAASADPWLLGSRLTSDAVLAYDGALSFHGLSGLGHGIAYLTTERPSHFHYNEVVYTPVRCEPRSLEVGVEVREREGLELRVTTRERTLVDLLDRLDLAPPLPELYALYAKLPGLDTDAMVSHALSCKSRVLCARVGLFLSFRPGVSEPALRRLERRIPPSSTYFDRRLGTGGTYVARWHLVAPPDLADVLPIWAWRGDRPGH